MRGIKRVMFVVTILGTSFAAEAEAVVLHHYSWDGTIRAMGSSDPWGIGLIDVPFSLAFTLPSDAQDTRFDISIANFVPEVDVTIGGTAPSSISNSQVWFLDNQGPFVADQITIIFDMMFSGQLGTFVSFIALPGSSFSFAQSVETPPLFGNVITVVGSGASREPYSTFQPRGTLVSSSFSSLSPVPEPTALAIWGTLGGLGLIAARKRRKQAA